MPEPIDLSQVPLRGPVPRPQPVRPGRPGRGTGTSADEYARPVMWTAFVLSLLLLLFLIAGLYSGAWGKAELHLLSAGALQRQMQNIALVYQFLQVTSFVALVGLLIVAMRDDKVGYVLLAIALFFYVGLPAMTGAVYDYRGFKTSHITNLLMADFQMLAWIFFVPGVLWTGADLLRRFRAASEAHSIQRVNMKYGAAVPKQKTVKQQFLGACWQLPYCRDHVREKCPVFLRKRGPCWWHKEGCMCEERIILQAVITTDWKQKAARADAAYNFGQQRAGLTPGQKRERCRKCVIYNEHQRQKYKAMVTVALVLLPVIVYFYSDVLQDAALRVLGGVETIMQRFSFGESPAQISYLHGHPSAVVEWSLIAVLCLVGLTQVLKVIEFWCFKLKL